MAMWAAQTGNTYISGTVTDSIEFPMTNLEFLTTMSSKMSLNDCDNNGQPESLPRLRSGVSDLLQCAWPVWPPGSGGLGSTPGSGGLFVHAGRLTAYSEINISGRQRGSACVLLNL